MTRRKRIERFVGGQLSNAFLVAAGYVWASHGIWWALALEGVFLLVVFALYGLCRFPWGKAAA